MKSDIEGSEYEVLPALVASGLACHLNVLIVEWHPYRPTRGKAYALAVQQRVETTLVACGVSLYDASPDGHSGDAFELKTAGSPRRGLSAHDDERCCRRMWELHEGPGVARHGQTRDAQAQVACCEAVAKETEHRTTQLSRQRAPPVPARRRAKHKF